MEFTEAIKIALQSLWANKLRSILTLMGVMIGVAAVIMVITLVNGANKFVATKVYGYGADVFTASKQPSVIFSDAEFNKYQKRKDLKLDDYFRSGVKLVWIIDPKSQSAEAYTARHTISPLHAGAGKVSSGATKGPSLAACWMTF